MEPIQCDVWLLAFVKENIITLGIVYAVLKGMFPESRFLKAVGDAFKKIPYAGKKEQS